MQRWRIRKWPKCVYSQIWDVFDPDGNWSGSFESWGEAMEWATNPIARLEHWLAHQVVGH